MVRMTLLLAVLAGCESLPARELSCDIDLDCSPGRVCDRGVCVVGERDGDGGIIGDDGGVDDAPLDARFLDARTIDAAPCDAVTCSGTAKTFQDARGNCWSSCPTTTDFDGAKNTCAAWGGIPVTLITTDDQLAFDMVQTTGRSYWLGLVQAPGSNTVGTGWAWSTGEPVSGTDPRWASGEPNDSNGSENHDEDNAFINPMDGFQDKNDVGPESYACRR